MDHDSESTWLPWDNQSSTNDSSHCNNHTDTIDPIYVFTPAGDTAKRVVGLVLSTAGGIGLLGNCLIFYYLLQKPSRNPIQSSSFVTNLNLYLKSLSLSDLLSCVVSLPLVCVQMFFDVFQTGWPCKIARYLNYIFPVITMNNLLVISIEKYLSTRSVLRTFKNSKIRKIIVCAWVLGLVVPLFPTAAFDGTKLFLNSTHYTVVCVNQRGFYPFEISLIIVPLQYVLPSVLVTYINICLIKTVCSRRRQTANGNINNTFKAHLRAKKTRGTILLIALTFAFIIPYFFQNANTVYTKIAKPQRDFSTDYVIRASFAAVLYLHSTINFIIYFAQMKEFREFLKKLLCRRSNEVTQLNQNKTEGRIMNGRAYAMHNAGIEDNAVELRQFKIFNPL